MAFIMQALSGVFTIIFVVGIGFVLSKKGWFDENSSKLIAKLVTTVSLPLYMITSLTKNFTAEQLIAMAPDMLLPVCSILLAMVVGQIAGRVLNIARGRRGVFITNFFIANTMFIGLPVNQALFGDESIPSVMLYFMVNLIIFWTLGLQNIVADTSGSPGGIFSLAVLKKLWTPPMQGFVAAIILIFANIQLPDFLMSGFRYVGSLTTPLSLIFIGIEISRVDRSQLHLDRDLIYSLVGRFIVCPACVLVLLPLLPVSDISAKVFTMQAAMPAMTQMAIVAKQYGADSVYASTLSFVTILGGLLVIPLYMVIVNL